VFACLHAPSSKSDQLLEIGWQFSPLTEQTSSNTIILDLCGLSNLFGQPDEIALLIDEHARKADTKVNIAIADNPDAAATLALTLTGITVLQKDHQRIALATLPVTALLKLPVVLSSKKTSKAIEEIFETFELWGIKTLGDLADLPEEGIAERLGPEGIQLQQLAKGTHQRALDYLEPHPLFSESVDLESPIELLEQLSFVVSGMMGRLCTHLATLGLAANEVLFKAQIEPDSLYERSLQLPFPMTGSNWLTRLLMIEIESHPPDGGMKTVSITASPARPRTTQRGLFEQFAPEPEKIELTIARLSRLVGRQNVGTVEVVEDHKPDSFWLRDYSFDKRRKPHGRVKRKDVRTIATLRLSRPPQPAQLQIRVGRFIHLKCKGSHPPLSGRVISQSGPWMISGHWWSLQTKYNRQEWDLVLNDGTICKVFLNLEDGQWYVAGIYD
jgi:protein ImuB